MGRTILKSEYSRQQGAQSFRNVVLAKDDQLAIDEVAAYPQADDQGNLRHYVQFNREGTLLRMPLSDAAKHKDLCEDYTEGDEERVKFPAKVQVVEAKPREVGGELRYPFEAYFTGPGHKKEILRQLRSKDEQVDWQEFYFSEDTRAAAKASGLQPVQDYTFKEI